MIADNFHVFVFVAIRSSIPDVSISVMPITDYVFQDMKNFGNRPALVSGQPPIFVPHEPAIYLHLFIAHDLCQGGNVFANVHPLFVCP